MLDITELLDELDIPYVLPGEHEHASKFISIDCPQWSPGWGHYRLGIPEDGWIASCWQCGRMGLVDVLSELSSQKPGLILDLLKKRRPTSPFQPPATGTLKVPHGIGPLKQAHLSYLRSRGISKQATELWGIGGIANAVPRLQWRLFLPVFFNGQMVSWTTRSLSTRHDRRYISARPSEERIAHKKLLYGEDLVKHVAIVVEGPIDAVKIGPGGVATFGTLYTTAQMRRIARFPVRYICFDAEPAAQQQAKKLCRELSALPGHTENLLLESGKDPGECGKKELKQLRGLLA